MGYCSWFLLSCFLWSFLNPGTHQLQSSQTQVLLQLRKHLEYPNQLEFWNNHGMDLCYLSPSTQVNMTCQDNVVTELRMVGDKPAMVNSFVGFAITSQTLSGNFSMDSFVTTLARLTSLRVLSLVSLGIWGPLPDKIHRLSTLEYLDLSSNYLFGSIPPKISTMVKLQTLNLDDNFFNDTIPDWFDSLSNLTILSLRNNQLKGPFPSSIQRVASLTDLILSGNDISGKLPNLDRLSKLNMLDLSENSLDSDLPSLPKGLVMAFLSNNSLSGQIPRQYSQLRQLRHFDMSFNELSGKIPASLLSLPSITYLNLASNMLSGSLPDYLTCGSKLQFVDVSNNRLTGGLPYCFTKSGNRVVKFGGNCLSVDLHHQHAESSCMDAPVKRKHSGGRNTGVLAGVLAGISVIIVLLSFGLVMVHRRYCSRGTPEQHLLPKAEQDKSVTGFSEEILSSARFVSEAAKLGIQGLPACRSFTLEELKEATDNFNNSTILGDGSYGKLYKGILENGTRVAIRCVPSSMKYSMRNLKLRMDLLAKLRHPHLVCLLGHLKNVFLVYEYVSNGNFRAHLSEDSPGKVLNWSERLAVLISVAKAIQFLHTGVIPGFFNNRLKANNILLNEHGIAKLSDYGLSIISEASGNCGDDVSSFGFILLESLVGPSVSARRDKLVPNELASCNSQEGRQKSLNPIVLATGSQESLSVVITITNKCICSESWNRPSFEDILWNLQYAVQVQATADGEQFR
ncbi:inactive leucine-rich repeat receptor protein [Salix suchowensis]|nr:inactive leucine-rich repeat receptor protein [Salix suchowensis]